jgi:Asp/Glu/hydantoin racemase
MIANREAHLDAIVDAIRAGSGDAILLGGEPLAGLGMNRTEETGVTVLDGVEASVAATFSMGAA